MADTCMSQRFSDEDFPFAFFTYSIFNDSDFTAHFNLQANG